MSLSSALLVTPPAAPQLSLQAMPLLEPPPSRYGIGGDKQQAATAEAVAADTALRLACLPATTILSEVMGKSVRIVFEEDNEVTISVLKSGKNPTMRHLGRTHRVNVAWSLELLEVFLSDNMVLNKCDTKDQAADSFTKSFIDESGRKRSNLAIRAANNTFISNRAAIVWNSPLGMLSVERGASVCGF
eukprot:2194824-Amphidinium_carterae.4